MERALPASNMTATGNVRPKIKTSADSDAGTVTSGWRKIRFSVAFCVALLLAIDAIGSFFLGGIPEGSAVERTAGWASCAVILIAPAVLWRTRNSRAGLYLQDAFIFLVAAYIVAAFAFS